MKNPEDITDRHMEDLGARLADGVVVPYELYTPIRATVLAAVEEALGVGYLPATFEAGV